MTNTTPEEEEAWQEYERQVKAARRKNDGARFLSVIEEAEHSRCNLSLITTAKKWVKCQYVRRTRLVIVRLCTK